MRPVHVVLHIAEAGKGRGKSFDFCLFGFCRLKTDVLFVRMDYCFQLTVIFELSLKIYFWVTRYCVPCLVPMLSC